AQPAQARLWHRGRAADWLTSPPTVAGRRPSVQTWPRPRRGQPWPSVIGLSTSAPEPLLSGGWIGCRAHAAAPRLPAGELQFPRLIPLLADRFSARSLPTCGFRQVRPAAARSFVYLSTTWRR